MKCVDFSTMVILLLSIDHYLITLVPKSNNSKKPNHQFRPTSICTTLYKIVFKILVARL